jgi:hypothetical protein
MDNLTDEQRDMVLRFLLHRMPMDTRHELMRTLPVAYLTLYPGTRHAVLEKVTRALETRKAPKMEQRTRKQEQKYGQALGYGWGQKDAARVYASGLPTATAELPCGRYVIRYVLLSV